MSGHSHSSNVAVKKAKTDAKKSQIFTKIGREIVIAARNDNNPLTNSKLAFVIQKAKLANMPNETIKKCLNKISDRQNCDSLEEIVYEGYGPFGSAIIVETVTDNKNRIVDNLRTIFKRNNGSLCNVGCVSYMFKKICTITILKTDNINCDSLLENIIMDIDNYNEDSKQITLLIQPSSFFNIKKYLEDNQVTISNVDDTMICNNNIVLNDDEYKQFKKFIDNLESLDDVQNIYHNVSNNNKVNADMAE